MYRLLASLVLSLLAVAVPAADTGRIEVKVDAIRSDDGQIFVSLFNKAEGFPGAAGAAFRTLQAKQANGTATVTFEDLPYGDYAVAAHHDEDGNGRMKTVYGTLPLEGIGISRDAKGVMGPPKFADASVRLEQPVLTVNVSIRY